MSDLVYGLILFNRQEVEVLEELLEDEEYKLVDLCRVNEIIAGDGVVATIASAQTQKRLGIVENIHKRLMLLDGQQENPQ